MLTARANKRIIQGDKHPDSHIGLRRVGYLLARGVINMKSVAALALLICQPGPGLAAAGAVAKPYLPRPGAVRGVFGALAFEENRGQFDARVKFVFGREAMPRSSGATA